MYSILIETVGHDDKLTQGIHSGENGWRLVEARAKDRRRCRFQIRAWLLDVGLLWCENVKTPVRPPQSPSLIFFIKNKLVPNRTNQRDHPDHSPTMYTTCTT
jgi:hypothetical protein